MVRINSESSQGCVLRPTENSHKCLTKLINKRNIQQKKIKTNKQTTKKKTAGVQRAKVKAKDGCDMLERDYMLLSEQFRKAVR